MGSSPTLAFRFQRNECFFPVHSLRIISVDSLRDREIACSTSDRQSSNFESRGQCHRIHLLILTRFPWPSLAYLCAQRWHKTPFMSMVYAKIFQRCKGSPLQRWDRLQSSESDICRRQILTSKVDPRIVGVRIFIMVVDP